jgi:hypothetical protein
VDSLDSFEGDDSLCESTGEVARSHRTNWDLEIRGTIVSL